MQFARDFCLLAFEKFNWEFDEVTLKLFKKVREDGQEGGDLLKDPLAVEDPHDESDMDFGEKAKIEVLVNRVEVNGYVVEVVAWDSKKKKVLATEMVDLPYDMDAEPGMNEKRLDEEANNWVFDANSKNLSRRKMSWQIQRINRHKWPQNFPRT